MYQTSFSVCTGLVWFTVIFLRQRVTAECGVLKSETELSGMVANTSMIGSASTGVSLAKCYYECTIETGCMSFFYNGATRTCQLHSLVFLSSKLMYPSPGDNYFRFNNASCRKEDGYMLNRKLDICFGLFEFSGAATYDILNAICPSKFMTVDNMEKQNLVASTVKTGSERSVLIGLTREPGSTRWHWPDNETATWTNWKTDWNEPNLSPSDLVGQMSKYGDYQWQDKWWTGNKHIYVACEL